MDFCQAAGAGTWDYPLTHHLTDFVQFAQAIDRLNNDNDQQS